MLTLYYSVPHASGHDVIQHAKNLCWKFAHHVTLVTHAVELVLRRALYFIAYAALINWLVGWFGFNTI